MVTRQSFLYPWHGPAVGIQISLEKQPPLQRRKLRPKAYVGLSRRWLTSPATQDGEGLWKELAKTHTSAQATGKVLVEGYQGADLADSDTVVACPKHYLAYGGVEGGRDYNTVDISERALREVYLPPFKAAVDAGAATIMSAYIDLCGIPASANPHTLKIILPQELGFEGFVVSNWNTTGFLGVNYYTRLLATYDPSNPATRAKVVQKNTPTTEKGWAIYPNGLYEVLMRFRTDYGNPVLYVTENGAAFEDNVIRDGRIQDDDRIAFLCDHLMSAYRAIKDGVRLKGYFIWTIIDNFEWAQGYRKRFGLVHTNYQTLKRTPKKSFYWYKQVMANSGLAFWTSRAQRAAPLSLPEKTLCGQKSSISRKHLIVAHKSIRCQERNERRGRGHLNSFLVADIADPLLVSCDIFGGEREVSKILPSLRKRFK